MGSIVCFALFLGAVGVCLAEGWQLMWAIWAGIAVFAVLGLARHVPVRVMAAGAWRQGRKMCSVIDIYLLIGAITALWRSAGTIGFFIYHGLQIITPQMFLLVAFLLTSFISYALGTSFGVIGTVGVRVGDERAKTAHTTPESPDLQELFARMRDAHCDVVAMEVSSHALDLRRTWATRFAVTAFTNLTQDHLDYHHTFEAYFEAKALLFSKDYPAKRVICIDDKWGRELLRRCSAAGDNVVTTGFDPSAQIHPGEIVYAPTHTSVELHVRGERFRFDYPLAGRFNVSNIMNAFGIGLQLGIPADLIVQALSESPQVPGRLERVHAAHDGGVSVFVDYAHTPDALKKALGSIIALTPGRTICVFGCGGDRDAGKRSIMGREALEADYAIVTSDNPRSEDPLAIIADIESGMGAGSGRYEVVPDRRGAIARALEIAQAGDSVLIAGKGHEDYQLIGDKVLHFDDREVAAEELERRFGGPAAGEGVE